MLAKPPKFIEFNGETYELETRSRRYYVKRPWNRPGPSNLHRAIWTHHYGSIPEYCDIHHRDENPLNNDISNLVCIDRGKHHSDHIRKRIAGDNPPVLSEAARLASAIWHREHGAEIIAAMPRYRKTCSECGREFLTIQPHRAKFCHPNCKQTDLRRRRGWVVGTRPHRKKSSTPRGFKDIATKF